MKRKPIKVDWDELEEAFDNSDPELSHYLDRVTGHVLLEGEGEEDEYEDDEVRFDRAGQPASSRPEDGTRLPIPPVTSAEKLEWVGRFVADSAELDDEVRSSLTAALEADEPVPAVLEILNVNSEVKEAWYLYRAARLHETVERWIEDLGIAVSTPPPWK